MPCYESGGDDQALAAALSQPSVSLLPSLSPETWSYALSSVLRIGLYPIVFDLGALAERVRSAGRGTVLPLELSERPNAVNDALLGLRERESFDIRPIDKLGETHYDTLIQDYYEGFSEPAVSSGEGRVSA